MTPTPNNNVNNHFNVSPRTFTRVAAQGRGRGRGRSSERSVFAVLEGKQLNTINRARENHNEYFYGNEEFNVAPNTNNVAYN